MTVLSDRPPVRDRDDLDDTSVNALIERARDGDVEAFGLLYGRYAGLVHRYISYRVRTHAVAEDLTSETFLRALRNITGFTWQGSDFGAWLVTIARNLVADHFKSGRHRHEIPTANMLDADRTEEGPEGLVLDAIANASLRDAVGMLRPDQRECVTLRFLQELSVAETAVAMGKRNVAVRALQYRAVRTLAGVLPYSIR